MFFFFRFPVLSPCGEKIGHCLQGTSYTYRWSDEDLIYEYNYIFFLQNVTVQYIFINGIRRRGIYKFMLESNGFL